MTMDGAKSTRHKGQWILLDEAGLLYAIGGALYTGVSTNNADLVVKKVVAPLIESARESHIEQRATARFKSGCYDVWVKPALGGRDGALIAVQACYVDTGAAFPSCPAIAVWEWEEPPAGAAEPLQQWWGEDAPRFYGVDAPNNDWSGGASGRDPYRFMDSILTEESRVATTAIMQDFRDAEVDKPLIKFMEQWHVATNSRRSVRAVGRKKSDTYYRGFSATVDARPAQLSTSLLRQLGAYAAITTDPLMVVDAVHDSVAVTSEDFAGLGVPVPADSSLRTMVHPRDLNGVLLLVRHAANNPGRRCRPVEGALKTIHRGWVEVRFHAVGTSDSVVPGRQFVMCRLEVLDRSADEPESPEAEESPPQQRTFHSNST
ncbi:hypothetical protein [Amycolatopsis sp. NPDC004378]